jgi:uncharacterized Fe-S cluster-containing radical SAM superfamily protein
MKGVDPFRRAIELRRQVLSRSGKLEVLLADFEAEGIKQKQNIKPKDEKKLEDPKGWRVARFDMPWWASHAMGGKPREYNDNLVYQKAGCNFVDLDKAHFGCGFCYVDKELNSGKLRYGKRFTLQEIVGIAEGELERNGIKYLRESGEEPFVTPEITLGVLEEIERRGLGGEIYFQADSNLSLGHFTEWLEKRGEVQRGILEAIGSFKNFGLLACFKGTSPANFYANTGANPSFFEEQFYSARKFIDAGIDVYLHLINPNPLEISSFLERIREEFGKPGVSKLWVLKVGFYGPTQDNLLLTCDRCCLYSNEQIELMMKKAVKQIAGHSYKEKFRPKVKLG